MFRSSMVLLCAFATLCECGCGGAAPADPGTGRVVRSVPPEYRTVAARLGQELKPNPGDFRNDQGLTDTIAEGHSAVMDLKRITSDDTDLAYVATLGEEAMAEALRRMERINALPRPQDTGTLMVESFIHGLFGNVYAGYALGAEADGKQKAIADEVQGLVAAAEKADAAHLLLPKVAMKYASPMGNEVFDRITVDFDESWYGWGPYDWCCLYNRGAELVDCTIVVEMKGQGGEVRKNVHFVPKWAPWSWMYARYDPGQELNGRPFGCMTVANVQTVTVTVFSPSFSTKVNYTYIGAEKDRDIAERCKDIKFRYRYQPFEKGTFLADTQRGMKLSLADYPQLGKCRVTLTFKNGSRSKGWFWDVDSWNRDEEKSFDTLPGELDFDPETVELALSFPGTGHKPIWDLKIDR